MKMTESPFADFKESASNIKKFKPSNQLFTLLLKDGRIIHYTTIEPKAFEKWLNENKIENIKEDII